MLSVLPIDGYTGELFKDGSFDKIVRHTLKTLMSKNSRCYTIELIEFYQCITASGTPNLVLQLNS